VAGLLGVAGVGLVADGGVERAAAAIPARGAEALPAGEHRRQRVAAGRDGLGLQRLVGERARHLGQPAQVVVERQDGHGPLAQGAVVVADQVDVEPAPAELLAGLGQQQAGGAAGGLVADHHPGARPGRPEHPRPVRVEHRGAAGLRPDRPGDVAGERPLVHPPGGGHARDGEAAAAAEPRHLHAPDQDPAEAAAGIWVAVGLEQSYADGGGQGGRPGRRPAVIEPDDPAGGGAPQGHAVGAVLAHADAVAVAAADDLERRRRRQGAGPVPADGQPQGQDQGGDADGAKPTPSWHPEPPCDGVLHPRSVGAAVDRLEQTR
jgi:hypothetical protein